MNRDNRAKKKVMEEYKRLNFRIASLTCAFESGTINDLDEESRKLLNEQLEVMKHYSCILQKRLENWKPRPFEIRGCH